MFHKYGTQSVHIITKNAIFAADFAGIRIIRKKPWWVAKASNITNLRVIQYFRHRDIHSKPGVIHQYGFFDSVIMTVLTDSVQPETMPFVFFKLETDFARFFPPRRFSVIN